MAQKRIDGKDGRNHTLDLTFWQFAIQLILLIKSTDNKDGHLLRIDVNGLHLTLMNPLMILVKIIKLRWIHILSYDQMVSRKI
ncbi:hypothetical protein AB8S10_11480, partial [Klebsiella pneumoniae]